MREPRLLSKFKKDIIIIIPFTKGRCPSSYSRVEGALTWQHVADAACGPGISNLGTHGSARCLFSPSLDTMLIPHDYKSVCACMETAKPVIWVRGCEVARLLDRSGPSICRGLFSAKSSVRSTEQSESSGASFMSHNRTVHPDFQPVAWLQKEKVRLQPKISPLNFVTLRFQPHQPVRSGYLFHFHT